MTVYRSSLPVAAFLAFTALPAVGQETFRDSAAFLAALDGRSPTVEGFESAKFGQLIPDGSQFGGLDWYFNAVGPNEGGIVANTYFVIESQGLFLERDGLEGPGEGDYFYPGESVTVVFPEPVTAVGVFVNVGTADATDYAFLDTEFGSAYTGGPVSEETIQVGFFFVGLIADGPFSKAVFGVTDAGPTGWNADNLMFVLDNQDACYPDFDLDGDLTLFDFLAYVNAFNAGGPSAECDGDPGLTLFDFLCYVNAFNAGC